MSMRVKETSLCEYECKGKIYMWGKSKGKIFMWVYMRVKKDLYVNMRVKERSLCEYESKGKIFMWVWE